MFDSLARGAEFAEIVRGYVAREVTAVTAPLSARIAVLEAEKAGEPDRIANAVRAAVEAIPPPVDGKDGAPGAKGDPGQDAPPIEDSVIAAHVAQWLEMNPPAPGQDGAPGEKGDPGEPGQDAVVDPLTLVYELNKWMIDNPPPPGRDGVDGEPGAKGDPGQDGRDGVGLAGALIDRSGALIVTLTDGTTRELGPVVGRDGVDGKDGLTGERGPAGFDLESFDVEMQAGGRLMVMTFAQGDEKHIYELPIEAMIYRGMYKDDQEYLRGDAVTWAGSLWICDLPTTTKPGDGATDWKLAAKRGRDGKAGEPGPKGDPGKKGDPGVDRRNAF